MGFGLENAVHPEGCLEKLSLQQEKLGLVERKKRTQHQKLDWATVHKGLPMIHLSKQLLPMD